MGQITDELAQALWETLLLNSTRGRLPHGDITLIAEEFGLGRKVVSRIWKKGLHTMGARVAAVVKAATHTRGRKKVDRAALCERVAQVPVASRESQRALQFATNTSSYLIQQLLKEGYLRRALRRTRPLLTANHKQLRLKHCMDHVIPTMDGTYCFDPMYDVVHLDEKWFYIKKVGKKVYVLTGKDDVLLEDPPTQFLQSKRHIKKLMFLCAVARPRGDWDGKVGIWPIVETRLTQRRSVNRAAGVEEIRPVTMTREIARRMFVEDVIPAFQEKVAAESKIHGNQDAARQRQAHPLENDSEVTAAGSSNDWKIHLANQPAQSPDLNILDLVFFASIQSLQSQTQPRTHVDLITEVTQDFAETTASTLNKTFLTLQHVMEQIMRCGGGNDHRLGHLKKDKLMRAGCLPTSLSCDEQALFNARAATQVSCAHEPSDLDVFL